MSLSASVSTSLSVSASAAAAAAAAAAASKSKSFGRISVFFELVGVDGNYEDMLEPVTTGWNTIRERLV